MSRKTQKQFRTVVVMFWSDISQGGTQVLAITHLALAITHLALALPNYFGD